MILDEVELDAPRCGSAAQRSVVRRVLGAELAAPDILVRVQRPWIFPGPLETFSPLLVEARVVTDLAHTGPDAVLGIAATVGLNVGRRSPLDDRAQHAPQVGGQFEPQLWVIGHWKEVDAVGALGDPALRGPRGEPSLPYPKIRPENRAL